MFLDIGQLKIHFEEFQTINDSQGVPKGETLILLHGWGGSCKSLRPLAEMIAPHDKTILIDLPGFGQSSLPPKNWGVEEYSRCIEDFIKEMGFGDVVLIGHSFGASIALNIASKNYKNLKKVILCAPSFRRAQKSSPGKRVVYGFVKSLFERFPFVKRGVYKIFFPNSDLMRFPELQENFKKIIHEDLSSVAKNVKIPTLIIWGSEDTQTKVADANMLHSLIPHSYLEIYPGHGHNLPVKYPEILSNKINEFLKGVL